MDALLSLAIIDPGTVEAWLVSGGYLLLFGILLVCGLGFPMPEDIPLIAAGALIAHGKMHWVPAATLAWCGIIGGDLILYHLGRRFGPNITRVPYVGKHINVARLAKVEAYFERYGVWVVAVGRMFAGIRGVMVVTAGTIRFNRVKFVIADGLAAIVSGGMFMALGYYAYQWLPELMKRVERGKFWVGVGAVVLGLVVYGVWRLRRRRAVPQA